MLVCRRPSTVYVTRNAPPASVKSSRPAPACASAFRLEARFGTVLLFRLDRRGATGAGDGESQPLACRQPGAIERCRFGHVGQLTPQERGSGGIAPSIHLIKPESCLAIEAGEDGVEEVIRVGKLNIELAR